MKLKAVATVFVAIDVISHFTYIDLNLVVSAKWRTVCSVTAFRLNKLQFYHDRGKSFIFSINTRLTVECFTSIYTCTFMVWCGTTSTGGNLWGL